MTRYLAYCQGDILLTTEGNIPFGDTPPIPLHPWHTVTTLHADTADCLIIRLQSPIVGIAGLQMVGLRQSYEILSREDYALAGKGAELLYWDQNSHYCGVCGSPLKWQTEISKQCPECGKEWWPALATAIIVRVERGEEILLVRARNFRGSHYGLVAGFVETGETLEECVKREVWEETHIRIRDIRYFGSQPWPYPCGLMVGFTAQYESGEIRLQTAELCAGGWFRRDNLPDIPRPASIARTLIEDWMEKA